jgi:hypothetical protein
MKKIILIICLLAMFAQPVFTAAIASELRILGWVENAWLPDPGIELKAKLDTGAETSSLDSRVVKKFRKGGKRWVRFVVIDRDSGEEFVLVRERVRTIGVVQHDGTSQRRPVVKLELCVAGEHMETEVSLIDRSEFNYPLLVGRNALASFALVDASETFLGQARCNNAATKDSPS